MKHVTCRVRDITFGEGMPKICIPLIARDKIELEQAARSLVSIPGDVIEWRADYYPVLSSREQIEDAFAIIHRYLSDRILLFTFRTLPEGGEKPLSAEEYVFMNQLVLRYGKMDLLDVELSAGEQIIQSLLTSAREAGVKVILSSHDFRKTPSAVDMVRTLCKMQELGADICKLAVMPASSRDVLSLLEATNDFSTQFAEVPLITMSMGKEGMLSRISGELFGSCMTFGCAGEASAPGQLDALDLAMILQILHKDA